MKKTLLFISLCIVMPLHTCATNIRSIARDQNQQVSLVNQSAQFSHQGINRAGFNARIIARAFYDIRNSQNRNHDSSMRSNTNSPNSYQ